MIKKAPHKHERNSAPFVTALNRHQSDHHRMNFVTSHSIKQYQGQCCFCIKQLKPSMLMRWCCQWPVTSEGHGMKMYMQTVD